MSNILPFTNCIECSKIKSSAGENRETKFMFCMKCLKKIVIANIERVIVELSDSNPLLQAQYQLYKPFMEKAFAESEDK